MRIGSQVSASFLNNFVEESSSFVAPEVKSLLAVLLIRDFVCKVVVIGFHSMNPLRGTHFFELVHFSDCGRGMTAWRANEYFGVFLTRTSLDEVPRGSAAVGRRMSGASCGTLESQNHSRQPQRFGERQELVERKKDAATFCLGQGSASDAACCPCCQLRLTNATAFTQAPEQRADHSRKVLLRNLRIGIGQGVDSKAHEIQFEGAMAAYTAAVSWELDCAALSAGDRFAVTDRGEKSRIGHGFPLKML